MSLKSKLGFAISVLLIWIPAVGGIFAPNETLAVQLWFLAILNVFPAGFILFGTREERVE